ncbi:hypothetical protein DFJ73DRAFT_856641 [Zopfochytrium polystomum]|nr:hypothetical protein DFJ73DRAFT_856641 [Zopfochytrium polystomum]
MVSATSPLETAADRQPSAAPLASEELAPAAATAPAPKSATAAELATEEERAMLKPSASREATTNAAIASVEQEDPDLPLPPPQSANGHCSAVSFGVEPDAVAETGTWVAAGTASEPTFPVRDTVGSTQSAGLGTPTASDKCLHGPSATVDGDGDRASFTTQPDPSAPPHGQTENASPHEGGGAPTLARSNSAHHHASRIPRPPSSSSKGSAHSTPESTASVLTPTLASTATPTLAAMGLKTKLQQKLLAHPNVTTGSAPSLHQPLPSNSRPANGSTSSLPAPLTSSSAAAAAAAASKWKKNIDPKTGSQSWAVRSPKPVEVVRGSSTETSEERLRDFEKARAKSSLGTLVRSGSDSIFSLPLEAPQPQSQPPKSPVKVRKPVGSTRAGREVGENHLFGDPPTPKKEDKAQSLATFVGLPHLDTKDLLSNKSESTSVDHMKLSEDSPHSKLFQLSKAEPRRATVPSVGFAKLGSIAQEQTAQESLVCEKPSALDGVCKLEDRRKADPKMTPTHLLMDLSRAQPFDYSKYPKPAKPVFSSAMSKWASSFSAGLEGDNPFVSPDSSFLVGRDEFELSAERMDIPEVKQAAVVAEADELEVVPTQQFSSDGMKACVDSDSPSSPQPGSPLPTLPEAISKSFPTTTMHEETTKVQCTTDFKEIDGTSELPSTTPSPFSDLALEGPPTSFCLMEDATPTSHHPSLQDLAAEDDSENERESSDAEVDTQLGIGDQPLTEEEFAVVHNEVKKDVELVHEEAELVKSKPSDEFNRVALDVSAPSPWDIIGPPLLSAAAEPGDAGKPSFAEPLVEVSVAEVSLPELNVSEIPWATDVAETPGPTDETVDHIDDADVSVMDKAEVSIQSQIEASSIETRTSDVKEPGPAPISDEDVEVPKRLAEPVGVTGASPETEAPRKSHDEPTAEGPSPSTAETRESTSHNTHRAQSTEAGREVANETRRSTAPGRKPLRLVVPGELPAEKLGDGRGGDDDDESSDPRKSLLSPPGLCKLPSFKEIDDRTAKIQEQARAWLQAVSAPLSEGNRAIVIMPGEDVKQAQERKFLETRRSLKSLKEFISASAKDIRQQRLMLQSVELRKAELRAQIAAVKKETYQITQDINRYESLSPISPISPAFSRAASKEELEQMKPPARAMPQKWTWWATIPFYLMVVLGMMFLFGGVTWWMEVRKVRHEVMFGPVSRSYMLSGVLHPSTVEENLRPGGTLTFGLWLNSWPLVKGALFGPVEVLWALLDFVAGFVGVVGGAGVGGGVVPM